MNDNVTGCNNIPLYAKKFSTKNDEDKTSIHNAAYYVTSSNLTKFLERQNMVLYKMKTDEICMTKMTKELKNSTWMSLLNAIENSCLSSLQRKK